jgi:hypothetical protein
MARKTKIEWQNPADMVYGTPLGDGQLNAKATHSGQDVEGSYVYTPKPAFKLKAGKQKLEVDFEPVDEEYERARGTVEVNVNPAALTVTITADDRVYDGTTVATLNLTGAALVGVVGNDVVILDTSAAAGTFADKKVGNQKPVTVTGLALSGKDKDNYTLTQPTPTASITPASLTVTGIAAADKAYDGTVAATIDTTNAALGAVVTGDTVTLDKTNAIGTFADANAGTSKTVTVSGLAIGGPDAGNYTLTQPTATATITAAQTSPGNNLVTAVKRALCDPSVNIGVTQLLREASNQLAGNATDSKQVVQSALSRIADAFAGTDAVKAVGEAYGGQLLLEIYLDDAVIGKKEPLSLELRNIDVQLIDANLDLAASTRTYDRRGILFSNVEAGTVSVALPSKIAEGAEISDDYSVTDPGGSQFNSFKRTRTTTTTTTTSQKPPSAQGGSQSPTNGFQATIAAGQQTRMKLFLTPPASHVRCFSSLEGDGSGCHQGKQYISSVSVRAMQGDRVIESGQTGASGCFPFTLRPGWYTFSAVQEVTIDGCNYTLASSSPVSAYLGADQGCSDIFFSYKRKGNEIQVVSEICHPDVGDPNEDVKENFPGIQYLLLLEGDQTFAQQQTTTDGGPVYFRNLTAGTYWLFCQAPATFGSLPVTPVSPETGRLTLRIFAGQVSRVPVLVKFRNSTTAPAVLEGFVRDDTGFPIPQQVVQVVNSAGCVVAAGPTDATGFYSIQIYSADDLTIVAGTQQIPVSKSQIQTDMKAVGTRALPSPRATLRRAVQASELVGFVNE